MCKLGRPYFDDQKPGLGKWATEVTLKVYSDKYLKEKKLSSKWLDKIFFSHLLKEKHAKQSTTTEKQKQAWKQEMSWEKEDV